MSEGKQVELAEKVEAKELELPSIPLPVSAPVIGSFGSMLDSAASFEHVQRVAKVYAVSKLVPETFRNNIADCIIACQMARRLEVDPLLFMQHTAIVRGKPALEGKFIAGLINARGGYKHALKFSYSGAGATRAVSFWTLAKDGDKLEVVLTMKEVADWGWDKNDVWRKQTDQQLAYRSAAMFGRRYCPELIMGLPPMREELEDAIVVQDLGSQQSVTEAPKGESAFAWKGNGKRSAVSENW